MYTHTHHFKIALFRQLLSICQVPARKHPFCTQLVTCHEVKQARSPKMAQKTKRITSTRWFNSWPCYPLVGGHLAFERVTPNHPKKVTLNHLDDVIYDIPAKNQHSPFEKMIEFPKADETLFICIYTTFTHSYIQYLIYVFRTSMVESYLWLPKSLALSYLNRYLFGVHPGIVKMWLSIPKSVQKKMWLSANWCLFS